MARTLSAMLELGTKAPQFDLPNPKANANLSLTDIDKAKGFVIIFMCNHCPFVIHLIEELNIFVRKYQSMGVTFIGINSNDILNYPEDSPENMIAFSNKYDLTFPYLFDESQTIAKAYKAECTPDFYFFDENSTLIYRGQFDGARPGNEVKITGESLGAAIDAYVSKQEISNDQKPSMGCNIKWK